MRKDYFPIYGTIISSLLLQILACTYTHDVAMPNDITEPSTKLILKSSTLNTLSQDLFSDTVEDSVTIGITAYLPKNIDSLKIACLSPTSDSMTLLSLKNPFDPVKLLDTVWYPFVLNHEGTTLIKLQAVLISGKISRDSLTVIVYPKGESAAFFLTRINSSASNSLLKSSYPRASISPASCTRSRRYFPG